MVKMLILNVPLLLQVEAVAEAEAVLEEEEVGDLQLVLHNQAKLVALGEAVEQLNQQRPLRNPPKKVVVPKQARI